MGESGLFLFFDADSLILEGSDIVRVWSKAIKFEELRKMLDKNRDILLARAEARLNNGYVPPSYTGSNKGKNINVEVIKKSVVIEEIANYIGLKTYVITLDEINCKTRMMRTISTTIYDKDGTPFTDNKIEQYHYIIPDGHNDHLRKIVCGKK
jgi:hypothetical protein